MIRNYTYIEHEAEKLQELVEHIVLDLWVKAKGKRFYLNRIKDGKYFRKKVSATPKNLKKPIHDIFKICSKFNQNQLNDIKDAFYRNNDIEKLCMNKVVPVFYDDLESKTSKIFIKKLKSFFENLYTEVFNQQPYRINEHYNEFFKINQTTCPFCALEFLQATSDNHRDDYDHYLPKSEYPFNAVNLKNLYPMCTQCNQYWKNTKNPIKWSGQKKKAYYYYSNISPEKNIIMNVKNIKPFNCDIKFLSKKMSKEVLTWNYLFNLSFRYKERLITDGIALGWHKNIMSGRNKPHSLTPEQEIENALWYADENPSDYLIFLQAPFLKSCSDNGLIL